MYTSYRIDLTWYGLVISEWILSYKVARPSI